MAFKHSLDYLTTISANEERLKVVQQSLKDDDTDQVLKYQSASTLSSIQNQNVASVKLNDQMESELNHNLMKKSSLLAQESKNRKLLQQNK